MAGANGERGAQEFPDRGAERDEAIVDVERSLGLIDATAANAGKNMENQGRHHESGKRRNHEQAPAVALWQRTQQRQMGPVNGQAEANNG